MKRKVFNSIFLLILFAGTAFGQDKGRYIFGTEQKLEMIVHVFGEVRQAGEFRVEDNTNVLELISKAGGPTEFSNLGNVKITRIGVNQNSNNNDSSDLSKTLKHQLGKQIIKINLDDYLNKKDERILLPILQPGDVVFVPRNNWFRWRNVVSVARDLSVIASVYFIYLRATRD